MSTDTDKPATSILLVEDDDVDAMSFRRALKSLTNPIQLYRARDGLEALALLRGRNEDGSATDTRIKPPFLIILDLLMPRMGGHEFLQVLRADPQLRSSVVFVMTTCDEDEHRSQAHSRHIAGFIRKELAAKGSASVAQLLDRFIDQVELPSQ